MNDLDRRIITAYTEAIRAQRDNYGARVHIEVAADVLEHLRAKMPEVPALAETVSETLAGFPLAVPDDAMAGTIRVVTTTTIY